MDQADRERVGGFEVKFYGPDEPLPAKEAIAAA